VKQRSWEEFFDMLQLHEKASGFKLKLAKEDFGIKPDTKLEKPFEKKQIVKAIIACDGPLKGEKIAVARAGKEERAIIVEKAGRAGINSAVNVLIIRDKHNIFRGVLK